METLWLFWTQYSNYILLTLALIVSFLFGKLGSVSLVFQAVYGEVKTVIGWLARALSEPDGNGGKPSFTKILGTYVVIKIVWLATDIVVTGSTVSIPSELMTLFMFLIGYQAVSKVLVENPAIMEIIKGKYGLTNKKDEQNTGV